MAHAPSLSRSERAVGIVERHELLMKDDGSWQVRDTAGSGRWYTVVDGHCSCPDATFRHVTCKHARAVMGEEQALADYCDQWNMRSEQARAAVELDDLPGNFLDTDLSAFDDITLTAPRGAVYRGQYFTAEQCDAAEQARKAAGPRCPDCGAPTEQRQCWCGKAGWRRFSVCSRNAEHKALPA